MMKQHKITSDHQMRLVYFLDADLQPFINGFYLSRTETIDWKFYFEINIVLKRDLLEAT